MDSQGPEAGDGIRLLGFTIVGMEILHSTPMIDHLLAVDGFDALDVDGSGDPPTIVWPSFNLDTFTCDNW